MSAAVRRQAVAALGGLLTACTSSAPATAPAVSGPPAVAPSAAGLTAEVVQTRRDEATGQVTVLLTNSGDDVTVGAVLLRSSRLQPVDPSAPGSLLARACTARPVRDAVSLTFVDLAANGPTTVTGALRLEPHDGSVRLRGVSPNISYLVDEVQPFWVADEVAGQEPAAVEVVVPPDGAAVLRSLVDTGCRGGQKVG